MALSAAASLRSVAPGVGRPKSSSTRLAAAVQPVYHVGVSPHPPPRFTPVESALGGVLVGTAAASFMLALGRVCGISGLVASTIIDPTTQGKADVVNVLFLLGLFGGGCLGLAGCLGPSCVGSAWCCSVSGSTRRTAEPQLTRNILLNLQWPKFPKRFRPRAWSPPACASAWARGGRTGARAATRCAVSGAEAFDPS